METGNRKGWREEIQAVPIFCIDILLGFSDIVWKIYGGWKLVKTLPPLEQKGRPKIMGFWECLLDYRVLDLMSFCINKESKYINLKIPPSKNEVDYLEKRSSVLTARFKANSPLSLFPTGQYARTFTPVNKFFSSL